MRDSMQQLRGKLDALAVEQDEGEAAEANQQAEQPERDAGSAALHEERDAVREREGDPARGTEPDDLPRARAQQHQPEGREQRRRKRRHAEDEEELARADVVLAFGGAGLARRVMRHADAVRNRHRDHGEELQYEEHRERDVAVDACVTEALRRLLAEHGLTGAARSAAGIVVREWLLAEHCNKRRSRSARSAAGAWRRASSLAVRSG
mmetsp:Transcript_33158/g.90766  ORF Transcript_33158/g.90766 Transcript_33158/m.90766 type:complete len:208 (+) Transcript_33158:1377-2000(+)